LQSALPISPNAAAVDYCANGGVENHVAQIAPAGSWRVWAEPETGGEAYVPLSPSKRARSLDIMHEVASRFGHVMVPVHAQRFADGSSGGPAPQSARATMPQMFGDINVNGYGDYKVVRMLQEGVRDMTADAAVPLVWSEVPCV